MKRRFLFLLLAVLIAIPCLLSVTPGEEGAGDGITAEFKDAPVLEAIELITRQTGISYAVQGELPADRKVTLRLNNAHPQAALTLICEAAGLSWKPGPGGWIIAARPTLTVEGARVPVLGALQYPPDIGSLVGGGFGSAPWLGTDLRIARAALGLPQIPSDSTPVTLEVKDANFKEVAAQLSQASKVTIRVNESVPKGLKVTARVYHMPLREVLGLLVNQANLTYMVSEPEKEGARPVVIIIPRPYLHVTGPGVNVFPGEFGGGVGISGATLPPMHIPDLVCPNCQRPIIRLEPDWKFCPRCGNKLPEAEQPPG